jgi:hypothetical protein
MMERLTMQSELLIELSDEQQEVVSGGEGIAVDDVIKTRFKELTEKFAFNADVSSGRDGSKVSQTVAAQKTLTLSDALKDFSIDFGGVGGGIKIG